MKLGIKGEQLIKSYEQLRLRAYAATADERKRGIWTIGWGHTKGVKEGDVCTQEQAQEWFDEDTAEAVKCVNDHVKITLSQNEFDALVSFCFNVGAGRVEPRKDGFITSTLLKLLNSHAIEAAANEFLKWNKQSGVVLSGLTKRRLEEKALFLGEV